LRQVSIVIIFQKKRLLISSRESNRAIRFGRACQLTRFGGANGESSGIVELNAPMTRQLGMHFRLLHLKAECLILFDSEGLM